jgi:hypothetical protein
VLKPINGASPLYNIASGLMKDPLKLILMSCEHDYAGFGAA